MVRRGDAGRLNDYMRQIIEDGQYMSTEDRSILNKHNLHILSGLWVYWVVVSVLCEQVGVVSFME